MSVFRSDRRCHYWLTSPRLSPSRPLKAAPVAASGTQVITFSDVTDQEGITNQVTKDRFGHGVAWGDVNKDGSLDLLLHLLTTIPSSSVHQRCVQARPTRHRQRQRVYQIQRSQTFGWTSGLAFADLDNDGDKDLCIEKPGRSLRPDGSRETIALRNDAGSFEKVPVLFLQTVAIT